jgi:hypothetical protein
VEARNRFLPIWFDRIRTRQITLPRFQRYVAWGHDNVSGLLTTVLRGLPSGAALILEVGDAEKFKSRTMTDAPESGERVTEQLLDGQQRLTALWRSLHDTYPDRTYLICFEDDTAGVEPEKQPVVEGQARWTKNGERYPIWVDNPRDCWERGKIPLRLMAPSANDDAVDRWVIDALPDDQKDSLLAFNKIKNIINSLRTRVREFNLPYLALPASTPKEVALDVFVKMNTSSVKLTTYDVIVALVEGETGKSLHEHVEELSIACPRAAEYADLPSLILDLAALRQDRVPSQAGYSGIVLTKMVEEWPLIVQSVKGLVEFLEEECVFDAQRLPSYPPLPVIAALWEILPKQPDQLGNARALLRKYLWRAFLTARYEQASSSGALQDFRALKKVFLGEATEKDVPVLNQESYPLPTSELILQAGWPKSKTILGRGLLALQLKCGAFDFADAKPATVASITSKVHPREYHHLFPDSLLSDAGVPSELIFRAVNCALVTWGTNRTISNKEPLTYLKDRTDNNALGEDEIRLRLRSHLIPFDELAVGYVGLDAETRKSKLRSDFEAFTRRRATVLARGAVLVCNGGIVNTDTAFEIDESMG